MPRHPEIHREADLSTQQAGAQAPSRFSRPDGHEGRPQGPCRAALARAQTAECLTATALSVDRIRRRADFLAAARGRKASGTAFVLQVRSRADGWPPRIGFTVTKKIGNAVERNRVRRRLREMVRKSGVAAQAGHDYVVIGRRAALAVPFTQMLEDFARAMRTVHRHQVTRDGQSGATQPDRRIRPEDEPRQ